MAYEIKDWKQKGCSLNLRTSSLSKRETFSQEIKKEYGEGSGLNANYRTVEAIAKVANILGAKSLWYGKDFIFKTGGDEIAFDFKDQKTKNLAMKILRRYKIKTI